MMEPGVSQIVLFTSVYAIGAFRYSQRAAFISRCLLCLAILIYVIVSAALQFQDLGDPTFVQFAAATGVTFLINTVFFGGAWLFGNRAWRQRRLLAELRAANAEVREQEQQLTRQALDLERVRIARELHDGVAHHIAGVGIHAAAARRSLEKNPDKAKESLQAIESSTRETVDELRALVYTLRDTDSSTDVTAATDGTAKRVKSWLTPLRRHRRKATPASATFRNSSNRPGDSTKLSSTQRSGNLARSLRSPRCRSTA